jgi:hypothetical protein
MDKVTKKNGRFTLEQDPIKTKAKDAQAVKTSDRAALETKPTDEEMRRILLNILSRIEALETG